MNTKLLQATIEQAQGGDSQAMSSLYDEYYDRIARYGLRRVLDQHVAEDITANVFIKVLDICLDLSGTMNISKFLYPFVK